MKDVYMLRSILFAFLSFSIVYSSAADTIAPSAQAQNNEPSVDSILEKYINALGGENALKNISSRALKGTILLPESYSSGYVEMAEKMPNKMKMTVTYPGLENIPVMQSGINGKTSWSDFILAPGPDITETTSMIINSHHFNSPLALRELRPNLTYMGKAKIGGSEAYIIKNSDGDEDRDVKLYFDTQTGLLLAVTNIMVETNYFDYKSVDGVMIPFTRVEWRGINLLNLIKIAEVKHNISIDDDMFKPPARHEGLKLNLKPLVGPPITEIRTPAPPPRPREEFEELDFSAPPKPKTPSSKKKNVQRNVHRKRKNKPVS